MLKEVTFAISDKTIDPEERRYVRYYQWVCFCLFFQVQRQLPIIYYMYSDTIDQFAKWAAF